MAHGGAVAGVAGAGRSGGRAVQALSRDRPAPCRRAPAPYVGRRASGVGRRAGGRDVAGRCARPRAPAGPIRPIRRPILPSVRLRHPHGDRKPFHDLPAGTTEILEAHRVTGDDRFVPKVAARSVSGPEAVAGRIATLGSVTTSVGHSSPLRRRAVAP
ncbi:Lrp/AsnC ligand binding domain-containing protein [Streptomyces niveus]|uniref:Lrp/AsnC ligand binding domain-containing protein n=1 Tax=Streptomyces niveus TaxID=193462 RepID=UPI003F53E7C9